MMAALMAATTAATTLLTRARSQQACPQTARQQRQKAAQLSRWAGWMQTAEKGCALPDASLVAVRAGACSSGVGWPGQPGWSGSATGWPKRCAPLACSPASPQHQDQRQPHAAEPLEQDAIQWLIEAGSNGMVTRAKGWAGASHWRYRAVPQVCIHVLACMVERNPPRKGWVRAVSKKDGAAPWPWLDRWVGRASG